MQGVLQRGRQVELEARGQLEAAILVFDAGLGGLDHLRIGGRRQPQQQRQREH